MILTIWMSMTPIIAVMLVSSKCTNECASLLERWCNKEPEGVQNGHALTKTWHKRCIFLLAISCRNTQFLMVLTSRSDYTSLIRTAMDVNVICTKFKKRQGSMCWVHLWSIIFLGSFELPSISHRHIKGVLLH